MDAIRPQTVPQVHPCQMEIRATSNAVTMNVPRNKEIRFIAAPPGSENGDYPTLPSRLTPSSFCASTANSIGSSRKTSLQKPLTIMLTAFSAEMPRCLQ